MSAFSHHGLCELLAGGSLTHPNEITLNCKSTLKNPISRISFFKDSKLIIKVGGVVNHVLIVVFKTIN